MGMENTPRIGIKHMAARISAFALLIFVAAVLGTYWIATGPQNFSQYPPAETSPYRLPFRAGERYLCIQSNRAVVSHRGNEQFAYDFAMPEGTAVCAARAGTVVQVISNNDGHGYHWPNNKVIVKHDDGTFGCYLHIRKDGSQVQAGDVVKQGQVIADSGHVGNSMLPHLHFHVSDPERKKTLAVTFNDVKYDLGIPRMFKRYTSGNTLGGG